jgi:hypothetical protein
MYALAGRELFRTYLRIKQQQQALSSEAQKALNNAANASYKSTYVRKVFAFLMAFLMSWTMATIHRIFNWAWPNEAWYTLALLQAITTPLRGFWNFLAYFVTGLWLSA